jgi:hypothetical protein
MSVRCKVACFYKEEGQDPDVGVVHFGAAFSDSPENKEFFKNTPIVSIQLGRVNTAAYAQFEVGEEYYLDFTPAN